jgi:hypothetical protein
MIGVQVQPQGWLLRLVTRRGLGKRPVVVWTIRITGNLAQFVKYA